MELLDYQGKPVTEGATVAFKYQGGVRIGLVKEIKTFEKGVCARCEQCEIYITHLFGRHTSKVNSVDHLCVVET